MKPVLEIVPFADIKIQHMSWEIIYFNPKGIQLGTLYIQKFNICISIYIRHPTTHMVPLPQLSGKMFLMLEWLG